MISQQKRRSVAAATFGFLVTVGLLAGIFVAVRAAARVLATLDSDVAVAIIAAAATAFVSVLSIVLGKAYEARALVRQEHRDKKTPVYEDLIKFMFRVLMGAKTGEAPTQKEMLSFMSDFTQRIMVWGSDDVLAAWVKFRRASTKKTDQSINAMELMLIYEQLILSIRRDLGHRNDKLRAGDLLALFLNDIDQKIKSSSA